MWLFEFYHVFLFNFYCRPDQTTRIHGNSNPDESGQEQWHEICRPQVHGYDLVDSVFLSPSRFVSIADEKVARVFDAPQSFISLSKNLKILPDNEDTNETAVSPELRIWC